MCGEIHVDKAVDVRVVLGVQVFQVQVVEELFDIPKLLLVEKIVVIQTSESLGTARVVQLLDHVVDMPVGVPISAWLGQCRKLWLLRSCSSSSWW